jgi:hypothetical protein
MRGDLPLAMRALERLVDAMLMGEAGGAFDFVSAAMALNADRVRLCELRERLGSGAWSGELEAFRARWMADASVLAAHFTSMQSVAAWRADVLQCKAVVAECAGFVQRAFGVSAPERNSVFAVLDAIDGLLARSVGSAWLQGESTRRVTASVCGDGEAFYVAVRRKDAAYVAAWRARVVAVRDQVRRGSVPDVFASLAEVQGCLHRLESLLGWESRTFDEMRDLQDALVAGIVEARGRDPRAELIKRKVDHLSTCSSRVCDLQLEPQRSGAGDAFLQFWRTDATELWREAAWLMRGDGKLNALDVQCVEEAAGVAQACFNSMQTRLGDTAETRQVMLVVNKLQDVIAKRT